MALFALWRDADGPPATLHRRLDARAHIVPDLKVERRRGDWRIAAFATATAFYTAAQQIAEDEDDGLCLVHGLIWRHGSGKARLLDAAALLQLLDRPGTPLPDDVAGEYAIVRLHRDGTLEAFGDPAGLHQIFYRDGGAPIVANRAVLVAAIAGDATPDRRSALWLGTIGYRVGATSGWAGVRQLPQGARLTTRGERIAVAARALHLSAARGYECGGEALLEAGLAQAKAAIRLAAGDGSLDLPITGGKDSRVVLAIALAAGLRDRLTLFTRGYAGHPDVIAGGVVAARIGVPHRREPPLGSDLPADLSPEAFMALLRTIAWQTDGGMGGWDNVAGARPGRETLVSGHLGEVLKAYAKRVPEGPLDPVAMVQLQAPFDPMDLLQPHARAELVEELADQMRDARAAGAAEADLPDLFYWRNRVPNWLGGIRGVKSFERQPVLPLGAPALIALAFRMTAAERKAELAHFKLIERAAPELIDLPFAHQSWDASLGAPTAAPILAASGAPLFGSWQWSINRVPGVRAELAALFAGSDIPLWEDVDRARLIDALHHRRFDYFDAISLLGFAIAAIHQSGEGAAVRLGGGEAAAQPRGAAAPAVVGQLDAMTSKGGVVRLDGWAHAPDWPGASVAVEARVDGRAIAVAAADRMRPDLAAAGIGDGRHAFVMEIDATLLEGCEEMTVAAAESGTPLTDGKLFLAK